MEHVAVNEHIAASPEPKYFLTAQTYCCEFEDGAIILELHGGTYLGIDAEHIPKLRHCIGNWPTSLKNAAGDTLTDDVAFEGLIAALLTRKILTTTPTHAQPSGLEYPLRTLTAADRIVAQPRIPVTHIRQFVASLTLVLLHGSHRGLASLLAWLRRNQRPIRHGGNSATDDKCRELVASFFRLRILFYTSYRHCLFDSLVLSIFLTRHRIPCTLVIGVSTKPFAAHSWVQLREYVLNDTAEYVQSFKPLLAIGGLH